MAAPKGKTRKVLSEAEKAERREARHQKFLTISASRATKLLKSIDTLGNLSSPSYVYSAEEIATLFGRIRSKLDSVEASFTKGGKTEEVFTWGSEAQAS